MTKSRHTRDKFPSVRLPGDHFSFEAGQETVSPKEWERAKDVVGKQRRDRLAWALQFAQQDVNELTPGDVVNDRLRLRAFLKPLEVWDSPIPWNTLPTASDTLAARNKLAQMLQSGKVRGEITLVYEAQQDAKGRPIVAIKIGSLPDAAGLRLAELLEEFGSELRRCEDSKCTRWFVGRANKQFCTTACLSRVTTERLRNGGA